MSAQPPSHPDSRHYALHGLSIRLEGAAPAAVEGGDFILRYLRAQPTEARAPAAPSIRLIMRDGRLPVPAQATTLGAHERGVGIWEAAGLVYLSYEDKTVVVNPAASTAVFYLSDPHEAPETGLLFDLMVLSVLILCRRAGYYMLHAACVVHQGAGFLISAESHSGKSSLAMSLVLAGWPYLADDMLLLHEPTDPRAGDTLAAYALGCHFRLAPEAARRFPEIARRMAPDATFGDKAHIDVDVIFPRQYQPQCTPRILLFPEIVDRPQSVLRPLSRMEALVHLLGQTTIVTTDAQLADQHMAALKKLVHQVRPYRLLAGQDIYQDPSQAAVLLAPLAAPQGV